MMKSDTSFQNNVMVHIVHTSAVLKEKFALAGDSAVNQNQQWGHPNQVRSWSRPYIRPKKLAPSIKKSVHVLVLFRSINKR